MQDISPNWKGSTEAERRAIDAILPHEGTPLAIVKFNELQRRLGDYWYWFILSTLWVSYSGFSDLALWRILFQSRRSGRQISLMKPTEWAAYKQLPSKITAYRAHRTGEIDWISYTLDEMTAWRFARERGVNTITEYRLKKYDVLALFLRRGEYELLVLDPQRAIKIRDISKGAESDEQQRD